MRVLLITNMYPTAEEPSFGTFVKDQADHLRSAGVEIDILFINGRQNKMNYFWGIFRFCSALLKKRYDIVHAHYAITGFIARLQFLYPTVVTYHGAEVYDHVPAWLKYLARRGHRIFNRVIVVSQREKEAMIKANDKVQIIPGGVDFDKFLPIPVTEARAQLSLPQDASLVLWAGEYWQFEKRFELVEASMVTLKQHHPKAELVLVSGKPHSLIPTYMSACDVLLLTSRSEGSPTVIKEAMACNLPIVSTDVGDVAEVIGGVEGCHLIQPEVDDIVDKLLQVLRKGQRTQGRDKIEFLRSDAIAWRVIAVYNELCFSERRIELTNK